MNKYDPNNPVKGPKESKQNKVDRVFRVIREKTGISRSVAESIADASVRGRDVSGLALQKGWPIEKDMIIGPEGEMTLSELETL